MQSWIDLPNEMVVHIMSCCKNGRCVAAMAQTCRSWNNIARQHMWPIIISCYILGFDIAVTCTCIKEVTPMPNGGALMVQEHRGSCVKYGIMIVKDNSKRVIAISQGTYWNGLPHGQCVMFYLGGHVYIGDWVRGKRWGSGMMISKNHILNGRWYNDIYCEDYVSGRCTLYMYDVCSFQSIEQFVNYISQCIGHN